MRISADRAFLHRILVATTIALLAGAAFYEARQAAHLRGQLQKFQEQQARSAEQVHKMGPSLDVTNRFGPGVNAQVNSTNSTELLKLRGEVARLRADAASDAALLDSARQSGRKHSEVVAWTQFEGLLSQMRQLLSLNAEQEAAVRGLFKGDELPWLDGRESDLKALLTAEQQAAFDQMQQQKNQDQQRLDAFQAVLYVLSEVQGLVGLSQEQQDAALPVLLEYGQRKLLYDGSKPQSYNAWEDLVLLKLDALKAILTEEQLAIYRNHEREMLKLTQLRFGSADK